MHGSIKGWDSWHVGWKARSSRFYTDPPPRRCILVSENSQAGLPIHAVSMRIQLLASPYSMDWAETQTPEPFEPFEPATFN